jgi:uncharacterized membrane protein YcaP (DUF421 family)
LPTVDLDLHRMWVPELAPLEVILRASIVYGFVTLLFRLAGRKELGRWGASDVVLLFLVTTAARMSIVADDPSVTSTMIGLATIVALDWALSALSARSERFADLVEGPVRRLVKDGALQHAALRRTRISEAELLAHVRQRGRERLDEVKDAWLERSGKVSIVFRG